MILSVWIEDFIEFDPAVVAESMREWRRGHKWRPSIAELRAICAEIQVTDNWKAERALPKPDPAPNPDDARYWSNPEYDGDDRAPTQRRCDAFTALERKKMQDRAALDREAVVLHDRCDEWARQQGYSDFDTAYRAGRKYTEVTDWLVAQSTKHIPLEPGEKRLPPRVKEDIRRESVAAETIARECDLLEDAAE